jgi:cohesin loading factor subunit SCC2
MKKPSVKEALEDRLSDGSPAVRDIAVDLVGKYIVQKPTLATEYYRHIADRVEVSTLRTLRSRILLTTRTLVLELGNESSSS